MISKEIIIKHISEGFGDRAYFIVDIIINTHNQIIILIDSQKGINIKECVEISRYLRLNFGEELDGYELQVSSPGLGQPFKVIEQYKKNIGKQVEIVSKEGDKIEGKLISVSEEFVEIEEQIKLKGKKNIKETRNIKIDFLNIKSTKEVIKIN